MLLVATAGHIDHGKTALVRALTGAETDRLPEEQARGISIDLGFAYWRPDDATTIGFVDVPGHERFVRNMLAGISGVHFALLVIAADDGIMPQTEEHLRMLGAMGIGRGVVVLTKCDKVEPARIDDVRAAVAELTDRTFLDGAPLFEVSSLTGTGMPKLAAALMAERGQIDRDCADGRGFRLAIDRAFSVTGAGTVVTGTAVAGRLGVGATLAVSPLGRQVRIRGLQSAGETVERVEAGQRCALNLSGVEVAELHRGDWLVEPDLHVPTSRIEASINVLPSQPAPLRHDAHVRLHLGAANLGARVLTPRQRPVPPGEGALVQIVLDSPTSAVAGERFVLRDQSGRDLIGGGQVLDPLAPRKRLPIAIRESAANALGRSDPREALRELASIRGFEPSTQWFARAFNLPAGQVEAVLAAGDFVLVGKGDPLAIARERFDRLSDALLAALAKHHTTHPETGGMTRREARSALPEPVSPDLMSALVRRLTDAGRIEPAAGLLRLPGHSARFSQTENALWNALLAVREDGPPRPIAMADLVRELRASEATIRAMLYRRRANGDIWQVTETKFMLREHVAELVDVAARLDAASATGFTAAEYRDASGIGRNFVIQLLEFFDRIGVTRRVGETRRMRKDYEAIVGAAAGAGGR